jgi:hypothetical protein
MGEGVCPRRGMLLRAEICRLIANRLHFGSTFNILPTAPLVRHRRQTTYLRVLVASAKMMVRVSKSSVAPATSSSASSATAASASSAPTPLLLFGLAAWKIGLAAVLVLAVVVGLGAGLGASSSSSAADSPLSAPPDEALALVGGAPVVVTVSVALSAKLMTSALAAGLRCDVGRVSGLASSDVLLTALELRNGTVVAVDPLAAANDPSAACPAAARRLLGNGGGSGKDSGVDNLQSPLIARLLQANAQSPSDVVGVRMNLRVPAAKAVATAREGGMTGSGNASAVLAATASRLASALSAAATASSGSAFSSTLSALLADPVALLGLNPAGRDRAALRAEALGELGLSLGSVAALPSATPSPSPSPTSSPGAAAAAAAIALATGDSRGVTGNDLRAAVRAEVVQMGSAHGAIIDALWGGGASGAEALSGLTWDPSLFSVHLSIADSTNAYPAMMGTARKLGGAPKANSILAVGGKSLGGAGGRFLAFAANPISDLMEGSTVGTPMDKLLRRGMAWLASSSSSSILSGVNITVAHQPGESSVYWSHDVRTKDWLSRSFPAARVNEINACENAALAACLSTSSILLIGQQMGREADSAAPSATTDVAVVVAAVGAFLARGGAVLYTHYSWGPNELSAALFGLLGLGPAVQL